MANMSYLDWAHIIVFNVIITQQENSLLARLDTNNFVSLMNPDQTKWKVLNDGVAVCSSLRVRTATSTSTTLAVRWTGEAEVISLYKSLDLLTMFVSLFNVLED